MYKHSRCDSTIAPPRNRRDSLTNVSWLLDTKKDAVKKSIVKYFVVCKDLSNDDVGVGGKGHRIPGNPAGSWFQNWRFR